jgi:hypothetical protein
MGSVLILWSPFFISCIWSTSLVSCSLMVWRKPISPDLGQTHRSLNPPQVWGKPIDLQISPRFEGKPNFNPSLVENLGSLFVSDLVGFPLISWLRIWTSSCTGLSVAGSVNIDQYLMGRPFCFRPIHLYCCGWSRSESKAGSSRRFFQTVMKTWTKAAII